MNRGATRSAGVTQRRSARRHELGRSSDASVVQLRNMQGLEAEDACTILGLAQSNQRVLLHRGRTKLRAALAARLET